MKKFMGSLVLMASVSLQANAGSKITYVHPAPDQQIETCILENGKLSKSWEGSGIVRPPKIIQNIPWTNDVPNMQTATRLLAEAAKGDLISYGVPKDMEFMSVVGSISEQGLADFILEEVTEIAHYKNTESESRTLVQFMEIACYEDEQ